MKYLESEPFPAFEVAILFYLGVFFFFWGDKEGKKKEGRNEIRGAIQGKRRERCNFGDQIHPLLGRNLFSNLLFRDLKFEFATAFPKEKQTLFFFSVKKIYSDPFKSHK